MSYATYCAACSADSESVHVPTQPIVMDCLTRESNVSAHLQTKAMYSISEASQALIRGCTPEMCRSDRCAAAQCEHL